MSRRSLQAIGIVVGVVLLTGVGRGLWIAGYEPATSDAYLWGAFHVHSTLSDGLSSLEEIAKEAKRARVDFVMLSDHGAPHPEAAVLSRTIDGVRFIGGSEVGLPDGHLIVSDAKELPLYNLPPYPPDAVAEAHAWGGIAVVTYPEDPLFRWRNWRDDFLPDGIEIVNVTSYFRAASALRKLDWGFYSLFNRNYYINGFTPPTYALARWNQLLTRGRVVPLYASNAHGGFPLFEETAIAVPSYRTALGYVGLGVEHRFADAPERAVRDGDFFVLVRAAGEPTRFDFLKRDDALEVTLEGGAEGARIDLLRNGRVVTSTRAGSLLYETADPGIYRVEVYLESHRLLRSDVPWILSNAIHIGVSPKPSPSPVLNCASVEPLPLGELHLEMDDESRGSIRLEPSGALHWTYHLSEATPEKVDRWVALALRKPLDLSSFRGLYLKGSAPSRMRYWVEVRSGDEGHYASVPFETGGSTSQGVAVAWHRFYPTVGDKREIPLSSLDALFVTSNTSSSRTGFAGELTLATLGLCR